MCNQAPDQQRRRKTRFYAIRNTYPDLLGTTVKDWMDIFGDLGKYKAGGIEPPSHKLVFRLPDKTIVQSEFIFLALDKPQTIKKLRGAQATGFWLNEIKELPKPIVDMCDLRHGRYPSMMDGGPTWHGMIGDTNQCDDDHWLYELAEETKPKNWEFFTQPGGLTEEIYYDGDKKKSRWIENLNAENLENLPDDYYTQGMEGKAYDWIKVNLANQYGTVSDGKPVYKEQWNEAFHLSSTISLLENEPWVVGLDFGLTPSAIFTQMTPKGRVNVLYELTSVGTGINQFYNFAIKPLMRRLNIRMDQVTWVGDPAGSKRADTNEQTVFKELSDLGVECEAANTNLIMPRLEAVRYYLELMHDGSAAFQLHPRCKILRKGFNGGYCYRRIQVSGDDKFATEPDKYGPYSHPHDALQYVMLFYRGDNVVSKPFSRPKRTSRWGM